MADAVAKAAGVPAPTVRRAAMLGGDLPAVAAAALTGGQAALSEFTLRVGRPVGPMLAQTATGVGEALERLGGEAVFEAKLDGARVQIHRSGNDVSIYTRSLDDVTARLPEVVEATLALPVTDLIADGEAIALRPDGRPHRFQVTASRFGRGGGRGVKDRSVDVPPPVRRSRCRCSSSTSCTSTASTCSTSPPATGSRHSTRSCRQISVSTGCSHRTRKRPNASWTRRWPPATKGDGEIADRAVRGGPPRRGLAEGEAGAHPRPRRAGRRVGIGQAHRQAVQYPPRRPRPRVRRISSCWARRSRA